MQSNVAKSPEILGNDYKYDINNERALKPVKDCKSCCLLHVVCIFFYLEMGWCYYSVAKSPKLSKLDYKYDIRTYIPPKVY